MKCEICGSAFSAVRCDARYCSGACRTAAYRGALPMSRKIAVTPVTDVPPGMVLLPEDEVEKLRGMAEEYIDVIRARMEAEGEIPCSEFSQPLPVTQPVTQPVTDDVWTIEKVAEECEEGELAGHLYGLVVRLGELAKELIEDPDPAARKEFQRVLDDAYGQAEEVMGALDEMVSALTEDEEED